MSSNITSSSFDKLSETLDHYRARIDRALFAELQQRQNSPFFDPFVKTLTGGKRLRPIILLLACESFGGQECDALPAAVAIELVHTESLIHDDIIDGDVLRRENASFYTSYGNEMALLSADFILSLILSITCRYPDPRVAQALATATACMCEGELLEVNAFTADRVIRPETYLEIIANKTAALFEAAARIGAIVGEATRADVDTLSAYARALGTAYQIHDDLVDGICSGSRPVSLALSDEHCSQDEYLKEMATLTANEACERLQHLPSSEAKRCLEKLAMTVGSRELHRT